METVNGAANYRRRMDSCAHLSAGENEILVCIRLCLCLAEVNVVFGQESGADRTSHDLERKAVLFWWEEWSVEQEERHLENVSKKVDFVAGRRRGTLSGAWAVT